MYIYEDIIALTAKLIKSSASRLKVIEAMPTTIGYTLDRLLDHLSTFTLFYFSEVGASPCMTSRRSNIALL